MPDLGIRTELFPGRVTQVAIKALAPGRYNFLCDNFCGGGQKVIYGTIFVSDRPRFSAKEGETSRVGLSLLFLFLFSRLLVLDFHGSANTVTVIDPGVPNQNPAAMPETTATYCLPSTA